MYDKAVMPDLVELEEHEIRAVSRVRIALALHMPPAAVDDMPYDDYTQIVAVLVSDNDISDHKQQQRKLLAQAKKLRGKK